VSVLSYRPEYQYHPHPGDCACETESETTERIQRGVRERGPRRRAVRRW